MTLFSIIRSPCPDINLWRDPPPAGAEGPSAADVGRCDLVGERLIHHSPDGYNWGYGGSGPADLALNILARCLPLGCDGEEPERLFHGQCSKTAWILHQDFKRHFLAPLPVRGGTISGHLVDAWIDTEIAKLRREHDISWRDYGGAEFTGQG